MNARDLVQALLEAQPAADAVTVPRAWLEGVLAPQAPASTPAGLLTVEQAAARLGWTPGTLYKRAKALPFTRKLGHRTLRFDAVGLEAWLRDRAA